MTEYELVDAFRAYFELAMTFMMAFISVTSAFLIATYSSAKTLSSFLAKLIVGLYSISSMYLLIGTQRTGVVISDIRGQMRETLNWHAATYEPQWILPIFNWLFVVFMSSLFIGSLWYFWRERTGDESAT